METGDRAGPACFGPSGAAQRAVLARQLGSGCHPHPRAEARTGGALDDPRAEFVPEQLQGSVRSETPLNLVIGESRHAESQLRLGLAWLDAQDLYEDVAGPQYGLRHVVEAHVAKSVERPSSNCASATASQAVYPNRGVVCACRLAVESGKVATVASSKDGCYLPPAPGRTDRERIDLIQLVAMFPTERSAERWFEETLPRSEPYCGGRATVRTRNMTIRSPTPCWGAECRSYSRIRIGTSIARSSGTLRK